MDLVSAVSRIYWAAPSSRLFALRPLAIRSFTLPHPLTASAPHIMSMPYDYTKELMPVINLAWQPQVLAADGHITRGDIPFKAVRG